MFIFIFLETVIFIKCTLKQIEQLKGSHNFAIKIIFDQCVVLKYIILKVPLLHHYLILVEIKITHGKF